MISGIIQTPLKQIVDDRGKVMHMIRSTDKHFSKFGEIYFSWINPMKIKAWAKHLKCYANTIEGYPDRLMYVLTGAPSNYILTADFSLSKK